MFLALERVADGQFFPQCCALMQGFRPITHRLLATSPEEALIELASCVADAAVFIPTSAPAPVGTHIHALVTLASGAPFLDFKGKVAWMFAANAPINGRRIGMGVLVDDATDETYRNMSLVLTQSGSSRHADMPGRIFWGFGVEQFMELRFDAIDAWRHVRPPEERLERATKKESSDRKRQRLNNRRLKALLKKYSPRNKLLRR
ncbi:MAG: hypothetical protein GY822_05070 [Deltaproteobacteria bacterium]|nr:hypothetical protein [Deltaproteobacteria bacterium]